RQIIGIPEHAQLLLFVGRIEPLKGVDTLLRAIAILKDRMGDDIERLCLSVIGGSLDDEDDEDVELRRLRALSDELGLGHFVTFLGETSPGSLRYYYSAGYAVIIPSPYELFGIVAL